MIFWELLRVFLLALCGLTGLFLLGGVVQEASQRGLSPDQILQVVPLLIPSTLPYTVPATVLFATCVVYGRLSHDNEITALRATGVHLGQLLAPAVVLAMLASAGLAALQYEIIPSSRQRLADRVMNDADELLYGMLKRHGCIRHPKLPFAVFVREVHGKQLIEPVFKQRDESGKYSLVAHAREAKLWTDIANDRICIFMPQCALSDSVGGALEGNLRDQYFEAEFPLSTFRDTQVRPMNLTWEQIDAKWDAILEARSVRAEEHRELMDRIVGDPAPTKAMKDLKHHLEYQESESRRVERALRAERQMRPALAIGGLCFVLVAFPVGIWFHRADYLSTFVSCFIPIVVVYYPLLLAGNNLAKEGRLPAVVSVWIADAVTFLIGAALIRRLFRQ